MLENKRNVYIIILLLYCNEYNYYYNYNIIHLQTYKQAHQTWSLKNAF